jgi:hypothetical protein
MPRRGAQQRDFPEQDQRSLPVNRIGIRVVRVPDRVLPQGQTRPCPTEGDVEFLPAGVRLTLTKQRARRVRHRVFRSDDPTAETARGEPVEFVDRPHREVAAIIRRLMRVTEQARRRTPDADRLFIAASVVDGSELRIVRWDTNQPRARFVDWLAKADLTVEGAPDIRRLRKSTKVEKAIAFGGRVADAANDHHEETFRGHYAQGTTLRVLSGQVARPDHRRHPTTRRAALPHPRPAPGAAPTSPGQADRSATRPRRPVSTLGRTVTSRPRLFPGRQPGTHRDGPGFTTVLAEHGIDVRPFRTAALMALAEQLPAAVLGPLLGLHPHTAVHWTNLVKRDWTDYIAARAHLPAEPVTTLSAVIAGLIAVL